MGVKEELKHVIECPDCSSPAHLIELARLRKGNQFYRALRVKCDACGFSNDYLDILVLKFV